MDNTDKRYRRRRDLSSSTALGLVCVIILCAFAIGIQGLQADVIWFDELTSVGHMGVFDTSFSPDRTINSVILISTQHVPLYFLIGGVWTSLMGTSAFVLRLLSLFAGLLSIPLTFRFGSNYFDKQIGVIAAFMIGTSAFVMIYFHEIRMYTLLLLWLILHFDIYWKLVHSNNSKQIHFLLLILTTTLLIYTHVFSVVFLAALGIYHFLVPYKNSKWFRILIAWFIGGILFLPYLGNVLNGLLKSAYEVPKLETATPLELLQNLIFLYGNGSSLLFLWLIVLLGYVLSHHKTKALARITMFAVIMVGMLILVNALFGLIPKLRSRYLLIAWFPLSIMFAHVIARLLSSRILTLGFVIIWITSGWHLYLNPSLLDYTGGMRLVKDFPPLMHHTAILREKIDTRDYYIGFTKSNFISSIGKHLHSIDNFYFDVQLGIDSFFVSPDMTLSDFAFNKYPYLLIGYEPQNIPENFGMVFQHIQPTHTMCESLVEHENLIVHRYILSYMECDAVAVEIQFLDNFHITSFKPFYDAGHIQLSSFWTVLNENLNVYDYNLSLQIISSDGVNVGQVDERLRYGKEWYFNDIFIDLESGAYDVYLVIYNNLTGDRMPGSVMSHDSVSPSVRIASFSVH